MMNCFCLNHASGMLRESFVMFFSGEKRTTIGEGVVLRTPFYYDYL